MKKLGTAILALTVLWYAVHGTFHLLGWRTYRVPGPAMEPTIRKSMVILVRPCSGTRALAPGAIVVFHVPQYSPCLPSFRKTYMKRIVAVEGQTVEIRAKRLYVDGQAKVERYVQYRDTALRAPHRLPLKDSFQQQWERGLLWGEDSVRDNFGPVTVKKGTVFVLGDNRDRSYDSRSWGPLPIENIIGLAVILPWARFDLFQ